jgi:acetyltransferase-like isoleucine patch superfamily enzyme
MSNLFKYYKNRKKKKSHFREWRRRNLHNETYPINIFDIDKVIVGKLTYGGLEVLSWDAENEKLYIGKYCSIAQNVKFFLGGNHNYKNLSTFPFKLKYGGIIAPGESKGPISIADDVWIGYGVTILSGVSIGQGAIIGAMSVVAKDVSPYAIVAGNPAKVIRNRFDADIIERLLSIDIYNLLDDKFIKTHLNDFYKELSLENIEDLLNKIKANTIS